MNLEVEKLERSFNLIAPRAEQFVEQFYERLFRDYPAVVAMFADTTPKDQQKMLLSSLVFIVENLRYTEKLVPYLKEMGARHVAYGTEPAHYDAVGTTLITTMIEFGGAQWTPEYTQAWKEGFGLIRDTMLEGARELAANAST